MRMYEHGTMQVPELTYKEYRVKDVGLENVKIDLVFDAHNPNHHDIESFYAHYQFKYQGEIIAEGAGFKIELIPEGNSELVIPVEVKFDKFYTTLTSFIDLIRQGKKEAVTEVQLYVWGEYVYAEFFSKQFKKDYFYDVAFNVDLPLPEINYDTVADTIKEGIRGLFGFGTSKQQQAKEEKEKSNEVFFDVFGNPIERQEIKESTKENTILESPPPSVELGQ